MILLLDDDRDTLACVNAERIARLSQIGPFTPDHLLHTKPWPAYVPVRRLDRPEAVAASARTAIAAYRERYIAYFDRFHPPGVTRLDPNPRIILVPGVGMFTTGKDRRAARIVRDLYRHTLGVIPGAEAIERYKVLAPREICDFEYWPLENFKLLLLPPEKPLSRRIALVTGAAGGIGRGIVQRLAAEGALVALADLDRAKAQALADEINAQAGEPNALALALDVTREASVRAAFEATVLAFGGLDLLVSNAGIARSAPVERLTLADWDASLAVNATGHFLVCREAMRLFARQGIGGNMVVIATKNVLAPGKDFGAYSASKAAQAQLSRILAIEGAERGVRVNMVSPDGVFENSGLWSVEVRAERAKAHGIPVERIESFYAQRNLLKRSITPADVAEAVVFLASDRSSKTTGAILPVDGGLKDAFPR